MCYVWLIIMLILLAVEGAAPGLVCIWFAFGAIAAFIASLIGGTISVQIITFFIGSLVFLLSLRPLAERFLNNRKRSRTNADAFIDREGIVTETIDEMNGKGQVTVDGKVWSARSENGASIECGTKVRSIKIEGVKLIVRREEQEM